MVGINLLGCLWASPITILGLVFLAPFYGLSNLEWDWRRFTLTATAKRMVGDLGAQTVGSLKFVHPEARGLFDLGKDDRLWRHEDEHRKQAYRWGVFFALAYGGEFVVRFVFCPGDDVWQYGSRGKGRWFRAYYWLSWEKKARSRE